MDRPTAFPPLWPPGGDDDFVRLPEVCQARRMYRAQKDELRELAQRSALSPAGNATSEESRRIANMLHNIAGTAAHFGERDFGLFAAGLEQPVRNACAAGLLRPLCAEILAGLDPQNER